jgi:DNA-binding SARP family transcriptional activator
VVTQRRRLALLALLATAGERGFSREKIAAYLWPEGSLDSTRRSLDQLVYGVRNEAGDAVILGANPLRLNPAVIESDVALFEQALSTGALEAAATLYRGPFLDGFSLTNAPEFERWLESERARLGERFADAVERLALEATARGDRTAAVAWWRRLAPHDPFRVPTALGLMRALAAAGDRGGALAYAKTYERLVAQELDAAPDPAITKLAKELRNADTTVETPAPRRTLPTAFSTLPSGDPYPTRLGPGKRRVWLGLGLLLAVAVVVGVWARNRVLRKPDLAQARILVTPFRVVGADSSLNEFGEGMVDLLAAEFTGEGGPLAVDSRTALSAWSRLTSSRGQPSAADGRRVAGAVGADRILLGDLISLPDGRVRMTGRILGVSDETVQVLPVVTGPRDSLTTLVDQFAGNVLALEAGIAQQRVGSLTTKSLPALRAYLAGRAERRRGRDEVALGSFARALEFDSTFALAALDLVSTTGWLLRWVIRTPFDTGARLVALLPGSNAARTSGDEERFERALAIAWREREKLSGRDRDLLLALRGERYPEPSYATEVLASLERATRAAPDRAETHYAIGHLLLHQGSAIGLTNGRERANASFHRALALDSSYAAPLAGLLELAALEDDSATVRRLGRVYLEQDSVSPTADYIRWRVAAGTNDEAGLRALRARFASLSIETLERIQTTSQVNGIALEDADRAMDAVVRRATDPYERWIALFNANILALNRGRPREALRLLRLKRELERTDDALLHNACLDKTFGDGGPVARPDVVYTAPIPPSREGPPPFGVALCRLARGDTVGAGAAIGRLQRMGDERGVVLDAFHAALTGRADAAALRLRLDSLTLRGCCAGPKWIGLAAARLHELAGDDASALRVLRAGRWLFPPQYLSTYLRQEGRLAARTGDRDGAIRAYRHYLVLRSNPEAELRAEVDRVRAELARLEAETRAPARRPPQKL